jgi:hypothetical protein
MIVEMAWVAWDYAANGQSKQALELLIVLVYELRPIGRFVASPSSIPVREQFFSITMFDDLPRRPRRFWVAGTEYKGNVKVRASHHLRSSIRDTARAHRCRLWMARTSGADVMAGVCMRASSAVDAAVRSRHAQ